MANTKLGLTNLLTQPGCVLKNGTGGGAPPLIETAPFPMSNLLYGDRYTLWKSSALSTPNVYDVDFDLGSTQSINAAAALGYRLAAGAGPTIDVTVQTGAYTPAGSWDYVGTIANLPSNLRDDGVAFTAVSARSVRFSIFPSVANVVFSLGNFFVGSLTDLGGVHSPEGSYAPIGNRVESPLPGGATVLTELGDDGATWSIPWRFVQAGLRNTYLSLQVTPGAILLLDADLHWYEVFLRNRSIVQSRPVKDIFHLDAEFVRLA